MKKTLSLTLALVMCLSVMAVPALAVTPDATAQTPYDLTVKELPKEETHGRGHVELTFKIDGLRTDYECETHIYVEYKIDDGEWLHFWGAFPNEVFIENCLIAPNTYSAIWAEPEEMEDDKWKGTEIVYYRAYIWWVTADYERAQTAYSNIATTGLQGSDWAQGELKKADELGLIPDCLKGQDLTKPITRAEFAAVSVKTYEALSGTAAIPAVNNPFTDTNDVEVLKAYNVGITGGTSATTFDPNTLLNREQAATMLTRVFKKVAIAGWTLATDGDFTLQYTKPAPFADDADISDYAKDSVYFMAANGIIAGTGNNMFSPKAVTDAQKAKGYAQATREQALIIAVRMVENLKK